MTARRPRLDEASEAYIARVVATFPPFSESDKLYLSRLVTPPTRASAPPPAPDGEGVASR